MVAIVGRDSSGSITTRYGLDGPGIESCRGGGGVATFSSAVQTGSGPYPACYKTDTGYVRDSKLPLRSR